MEREWGSRSKRAFCLVEKSTTFQTKNPTLRSDSDGTFYFRKVNQSGSEMANDLVDLQSPISRLVRSVSLGMWGWDGRWDGSQDVYNSFSSLNCFN